MNLPYNSQVANKEDESGMNRRNFLRKALGTSTLGAIVFASCASKNGNGSIDKYLRKQYQNPDLNQIDDDNFRLTVETHGDFIKRYMPYVNINQPTQRDKAFISQIEDIDVIISYITIDPTNLNQDQKNALREFNSRELTKNDLEYIASIPWINPKNLTKKDKIWLIQNIRATAESYEQLNQFKCQ